MKRLLTTSFLVLLTIALLPWKGSAQDLESDSLALVALYNECNGANWVGFDSWLTDTLKNWTDVTVSDVEGMPRVTHVEFSRMTLTGTLPAALGNLTEMSGKIQLNNQPGLTGEFPAFIWNWTKVERMQIKFCGFTSIDVTGIEGMVNLYEFNTQETPFEGEIPVEIFELPLMRDVYLEDGMWTSLPADLPIPTPTPLRRFYINGNQFTDLPDLTGMVWAQGAKIKIRNNYLTFEDVEPNIWIASDGNVSGFEYSPQETIGEAKVVLADAGTSVTLESNIEGGAATVYTWIKGVDEVVGDMKDLTLAAFDPATESGSYFCVGQNPNVPGLDIFTAEFMVYEDALAQDSAALVALYNECNGAGWGEGYEGWLTDSLDNWKDVTVSWVKNEDGTDSTRRVTHVEFSGMTLTGTLPSELGNLTEMSGKIQLNNQLGLTGEFPAFIWNWTKVERMQIKFCGFTSMDLTGIENMENLYEFNTQETPFEGEIPVEIFELPLMRDVYLEDGMWTSLPADMPIPTPTPLRRFYINGNQFTDLPDLTGMVWAEGAKIKIRNNYLTFEDIEPNMWIGDDANVGGFEYSPQEKIGEDKYIYGEEGSPVTFESNIEGSEATVYSWIMGVDEVLGDTKDFTIDAYDPATHSGSYFCLAQNPNVPGLDLLTGKFMLWESSIAPDSLALVALYNDCNGAGWGEGYEGWLTDSLDKWKDVTVSWVKNEDGTDSTRRVTHVEFSGMTLTGTLPEALGNITEMSGKIQLNNQIGLTGEFPAFIWNWTKVERMQIKFCGFTSIDVSGIENMVNLYEFNTQETPFEGEIPAAIFQLPLMRDVYLEDGMWTSLPEDLPIPTNTPLRRFYLNGNQFTDLPDLTGMVWAEGAKIKFRNNYLTFEDLEPNMWIDTVANVDAFEISPQAPLTEKETITVDVGDPISMAVTCGGSENVYTWVKDGAPIDGAASDQLDIASAVLEDAGEYYCLVQSALVPGLDIVSDTFTVVVNVIEGIEDFAAGFSLNGNPVEHLLSIDSDQMVSYIKISDITGKVLRNEELNTSTIRMEVSDLKHGVYFVTLGFEAKEEVLKIIKK
jgi:hypothetical protein